MSQSVSPATIDFIYDVTSDGPPNQLQEMGSLDGKLVQVFSAASVIIGLAGLAADTFVPLLVIAVIAYVLVASAALFGIYVRVHRRPFHSDTLLEDLLVRQRGQGKVRPRPRNTRNLSFQPKDY